MWQFDVNSSVLIVIDMQRDFVEAGRPMEVPMARERLPQTSSINSLRQVSRWDDDLSPP